MTFFHTVDFFCFSNSCKRARGGANVKKQSGYQTSRIHNISPEKDSIGQHSLRHFKIKDAALLDVQTLKLSL